MALGKFLKLRLGTGDLVSGLFTEFTTGSATPSNSNGSDGDVYFKIAGANSDMFLKRNGAWISLLGLSLTASIPDNSSGNVWFAIPAAVARFMKVEYGAIRGANRQRGTLSVTNDGTTAAVSRFGIVEIGSDVGLTLDAQVSGANLQLLADADSQGSGLTLDFVVRSWS